jgi:hypothetical protein
MITKNEAFGFWEKGEKKGLGESRASPAILCASSVELLCLLLRTLLVGALEGREYCLRLIDMRARLVLALSLLCNQINVTNLCPPSLLSRPFPVASTYQFRRYASIRWSCSMSLLSRTTWLADNTTLVSSYSRSFRSLLMCADLHYSEGQVSHGISPARPSLLSLILTIITSPHCERPCPRLSSLSHFARMKVHPRLYDTDGYPSGLMRSSLRRTDSVTRYSQYHKPPRIENPKWRSLVHCCRRRWVI